MALARITITIPEDLLAEADRSAEARDRSRSWLLVEALRVFLSSVPAGDRSEPCPRAPERSVGPLTVREAGAVYPAGLGPQRLGQLRADLGLTPEERVRLAQQSAAAGPKRRRPPQPDRVIGFDRLEDYFAWERHEDLAP